MSSRILNAVGEFRRVWKSLGESISGRIMWDTLGSSGMFLEYIGYFRSLLECLEVSRKL
jgi:hypothetical protein